MLVRLLDSHPQITCKGEEVSPDGLYAQYPGMPLREFVGNVLFQECNGICGFKMPFDWILQYPDIFGAFRELSFKLVFLQRRNKLDHFLSIKLAEQNTDWSSSRPYAVQRIHISYDELYEFFITSDYADRVLSQMCSTYDCLSVTYEELADGSRENDLLDYLGAERRRLQAGTVRARRLTRQEAILNFNDLVASFAPTFFSHFFHEPELIRR